jgi:hypothetical protein
MAPHLLNPASLPTHLRRGYEPGCGPRCLHQALVALVSAWTRAPERPRAAGRVPQVAVVPVGSPLQAILSGTAGDVPSDRTIVLFAGRSRDPDDPFGAEPLALEWSCQREDFPQPCFSTTDRGNQLGSLWYIRAALLAPDKAREVVCMARPSCVPDPQALASCQACSWNPGRPFRGISLDPVLRLQPEPVQP